jgi:hypothetical protein
MVGLPLSVLEFALAAANPNPKLLTAKDTQRERWVPGTPSRNGSLGKNGRHF